MSIFLLSVDLEDVSLELRDKTFYTQRIPETTFQLLDFFKQRQTTTTFFITGDLATKFPDLVKEIQLRGHEIGCHSDQHQSLHDLTPDLFKKDLEQNLETLFKTGAKDIVGYRAPMYSLTGKTQWVYRHLKEMGFIYSSSVLPASNPLYGWKDFGETPREIDGILEIPISLSPLPFLGVPFAGGVYFRLIPQIIINRFFNHFIKRNKLVIGYIHPQDIDGDFPRLDYENYGKIFNFLLNYNKSSVLNNLEGLIAGGFKIQSFRTYINQAEN